MKRAYLALAGVALALVAGCAAEAGPAGSASAMGNPITGEGMPNPAPNVTQNWGELPEGREWGSTAGIDIDPHDGHIWAYERCGANSFGPGSNGASNRTDVDDGRYACNPRRPIAPWSMDRRRGSCPTAPRQVGADTLR